MIFIAYLVLILSFLNLLRIAIFLIGSDLYDIKRNFSIRTNKTSRKYRPLVTVIVPAHNEEASLQRNLESILNSTYSKKEVIVVDDSSDDRTFAIARNFQRKHGSKFVRFKILRVKVRGKAKALNAGLVHAKGQLFMCLDADSSLQENSLEKCVQSFSDRKLVALSSNIKIYPDKGILNFFQKLEYLICYQMKKTEDLGGIQYIVGGIGSTFRTSVVKRVGLYDTDTITEDMDLSMKIIQRYGRKYKIGYNPEVITYTEQVYNVSDLLRQRFRWRYGSYQVFLKYRKLFWSKDAKQNKMLTHLYLPYALLGQILCALEPFVIFLIAYLLFMFGDLTIIAASFLTFIFYVTLQVSAATKGYTLRERLSIIFAAPVGYIGLYFLTYVEYVATMRGFLSLKKIHKEYVTGSSQGHWKHVARKKHA